MKAAREASIIRQARQEKLDKSSEEIQKGGLRWPLYFERPEKCCWTRSYSYLDYSEGATQKWNCFLCCEEKG